MPRKGKRGRQQGEANFQIHLLHDVADVHPDPRHFLGCQLLPQRFTSVMNARLCTNTTSAFAYAGGFIPGNISVSYLCPTYKYTHTHKHTRERAHTHTHTSLHPNHFPKNQKPGQNATSSMKPFEISLVISVLPLLQKPIAHSLP